ADRLVDEEKAARSALRHQPAHVVEARDETRALGPDPLRRKTLRTPGVWVRAVERSRLPRPRRELRDGRVAAVLEQRDPELLEHRLDAPGVEHRGRRGIVAVPVPCPARQMERVPRLPIDALPVDLGPPATGLDELDGVPRMTV